MNHPKLIQNHLDVPVAPGHQKKCLIFILSHWGFRKTFKNLPFILKSFGDHFSHFPHADACVALRESIGEAEVDPENIFPNIEDGRVFWVKRNCATIHPCGEVKNEILEPECWENTFKSIWISFYTSKPRCNNPERQCNKYSGTRHSSLKKWQKFNENDEKKSHPKSI